MSEADEAISRVRKLDALARERSIVKGLIERITAGNARLGAMDDYGLPGERRFSPFPSTSSSRFIEIANSRVAEIELEIEDTRAEFERETKPEQVRRCWSFWRRDD